MSMADATAYLNIDSGRKILSNQLYGLNEKDQLNLQIDTSFSVDGYSNSYQSPKNNYYSNGTEVTQPHSNQIPSNEQKMVVTAAKEFQTPLQNMQSPVNQQVDQQLSGRESIQTFGNGAQTNQ